MFKNKYILTTTTTTTKREREREKDLHMKINYYDAC